MAKKPNIIFLMTDQQRFDTVGALGNPIIQTPALDRIVREGTSFTSAYCPSPVCEHLVVVSCSGSGRMKQAVRPIPQCRRSVRQLWSC